MNEWISADTLAVRRLIEGLAEGMAIHEEIVFSEASSKAFVDVSGDSAPFHISLADARAAGYDGPLVHGIHLAARFSRLLGMFLPGTGTVIQKFELEFPRPLFVGDVAHLTVRVRRVIESVRCVQLDLAAAKGSDRVASGRAQCVYPSAAADKS